MSRQNTRPSRLGLLAAAAAVAGTRFEVAGAGELPRPVQPTFAEQLTEAISALTEAQIEYALARHSPGGAEWANIQGVSKAQTALQTLLGSAEKVEAPVAHGCTCPRCAEQQT